MKKSGTLLQISLAAAILTVSQYARTLRSGPIRMYAWIRAITTMDVPREAFPKRVFAMKITSVVWQCAGRIGELGNAEELRLGVRTRP
jgi:hypothetical protein